MFHQLDNIIRKEKNTGLELIDMLSKKTNTSLAWLALGLNDLDGLDLKSIEIAKEAAELSDDGRDLALKLIRAMKNQTPTDKEETGK